MNRRKQSFPDKFFLTKQGFKFLGNLWLAFVVVALIAFMQSEVSAQTTGSLSQSSSRIEITRLKIFVRQTKDFVFGIAPASVIIVSPEIASVQNKNGHSVSFTGVKIGETIIIITDNQKRQTFVLEVEGTIIKPDKFANKAAAKSNSRGYSGSYGLSYTNGFGESAALLRQSFDFNKKLSKERNLRFSSEIFKFFEGGNRALTAVQGLGFDRISLGADSPEGTVDVLDSRLDISRLSFNNYSMRGFHLTSTLDSRLRGAEFFAGFARQSLSLFDNDQGALAGATVPVVRKESLNVRAGVFTIFPGGKSKLGDGGTVFQVSGTFAPNEKLTTDAEIAYANQGLSWRARLDFRQKHYGAFGEIIRLDDHSPLISIGVQPGGRKSEALAFHWRPVPRFGASVNFNHTAIEPPHNSSYAGVDRTTLLFNATYGISRNSRLNFRFAEQQFETGVAGNMSSRFQIESRTATITYNARFNRNWSNTFETRINLSRERRADAEMENGLSLSDELRFSWKRGSAAGFVNYTHKTPSLTSLIVRNPQLLPPLIQQAFIENPVQFLQTNREALAVLLPGVELPLTRNFDAGVRLQSRFSRFDLTGETRYSAGEILASNQRNLFASFSANIRLDSANSLQISGWKLFGLNSQNNQSALTFSYTHRFGSESGNGFQFTKLLGLEKGRIQGRVFFDLNGNGLDDKDEPGVAGTKVQINEKTSTLSDVNGRFNFTAQAGEHLVTLISDDLGVRLRTSTAAEQRVSLSARQTANVSFGLSDFGSISGRIFNDLTLNGEPPKSNFPGIAGVRLVLRSSEKGEPIISPPSDSSGNYEFSKLRPGKYTLEIDTFTLPSNFRLPAQTSWSIKVEPLRGFYQDVPLVAQRAVSGIVFFDQDGDGQFNSQKDDPIAGAQIVVEGGSAISDRSGAYLLRNLPAGKIKLSIRLQSGRESLPLTVDLNAEPVTKRGVNFIIQR